MPCFVNYDGFCRLRRRGRIRKRRKEEEKAKTEKEKAEKRDIRPTAMEQIRVWKRAGGQGTGRRSIRNVILMMTTRKTVPDLIGAAPIPRSRSTMGMGILVSYSSSIVCCLYVL